MNLSGRYGASIGRSLGCSELHRCERRPFRARPADVIIIERQQRRANWHEACNVCCSRPGRTDGCYRESPVIKAKEYKLRRLWAALLTGVRRLRIIRDIGGIHPDTTSLSLCLSRSLPPACFRERRFNELHSHRFATIGPFTCRLVVDKGLCIVGDAILITE